MHIAVGAELGKYVAQSTQMLYLKILEKICEIWID